MRIIILREWSSFQHYKDRNPPWVKLYRDTLTSESWVLGTDISRLVQVASILLAARYSNQIPYRFDHLKKVLSLDCTESAFDKAIAHLVEANFLEIQEVEDARKQYASNVLAQCNTEKRESREEVEERRVEKDLSSPARKAETGPVGVVFEHWQLTHGHPGAKLDQKRRKRIEAALKDHSPAQLCECISGYRNSPHHMGTDPKGNGVRYDDIELFLRDTKHIEAGLRYYAHPPRPPPKAESATERIKRLNGDNGARVLDIQPSHESGATLVPLFGNVRS